MRDDVLAAWVTALRHGNYDQCWERLSLGPCWSAYGVLAHTLYQKWGEGQWQRGPRGWAWWYRLPGAAEAQPYYYSLPRAQWWSKEWQPEEAEAVHLWNDRYGWDFGRIADGLERHEYRRRLPQ